jgi:hypothetical protein
VHAIVCKFCKSAHTRKRVVSNTRSDPQGIHFEKFDFYTITSDRILGANADAVGTPLMIIPVASSLEILLIKQRISAQEDKQL